MKAMENKKEPLMSAEEYFNTKNFGTDFDFAQEYANYVTQWQQQQNKNLYSEEEVLEQLNLLFTMRSSLVDTFTDKNDRITMKWFEQFKKK